MMYPATCLALLSAISAGCAFQVNGGDGPDDANPDGAPSPDGADGAVADAVPDAVADAAPDAPATQITTNHPSVADSFLSAFNPTTNYNTQTSALADGDGRVALFQFDLSTIPIGAAIVAAELHIWTDTDAGQTCTLFPVLEPWAETTATWDQRSTGVAWLAAGVAPPSRGTIAAGSLLPSSASTEYTVAIAPAAISNWVAAPASNFGFVIVSVDPDGARFSTREHPTASRRPYLLVTHSP